MCKSEIHNGKIKLWAPVHEVESQALDQLKNIADLPWVFKHVAAMPDVHLGKGATVGSVIAMQNALAPAAVGVDIGCGMGAVRTNLTARDLPESLRDIRLQIERDVPVGFNWHDRGVSLPRDRSGKTIMDGFDDLRAPHVSKLAPKAHQQLGTLGGGNHFIELCLDTDDNVWVMLHSGSRNIGKELAEYHIGIARGLAHNATLPDRDLAVFLRDTPEMDAYRHDLSWAQKYAFVNRAVMKDLVMAAIRRHLPKIAEVDYIACHHNYVSEETHFGENVIVTRKGAIYAGRGVYGIIPGSMGTKSYIVRGLGNPESYESASHGAGRRMSRGAAKRNITMDEFREQVRGVECRTDAGVLDEAPAAYKDITAVMENQKDLVEVVTELKQVLCIKG
jgi:tRNA-splicing ligase RtcB